MNSVKEHSEILTKLIPFLLTNNEIGEDDIFTNAENIYKSNLEFSEYLDRTYGPAPTDDDITGYGMLEGMICVGCRQETNCNLDICINCSRQLFDRITESDSTFSNAEDYQQYFEHYGLNTPTDMDRTDASAVLEPCLHLPCPDYQ